MKLFGKVGQQRHGETLLCDVTSHQQSIYRRFAEVPICHHEHTISDRLMDCLVQSTSIDIDQLVRTPIHKVHNQINIVPSNS